MNHENDEFQQKAPVPLPVQSMRKKRYQKPGFRFEHVFETQALACTKQSANSSCQPTKKNS
jgi:hypothetical protein